MRRRSRTNSRKHEDRSLRDAYRIQFDYCELYQYLADHICVPWNCQPRVPLWKVPQHAMRIEVNHIWSVGRRPDTWANLISLGEPTHKWFHANLQSGRVAALWTKKMKGELNLSELDAAAGKNVLGWLESFDLASPFREWRDALCH